MYVKFLGNIHKLDNYNSYVKGGAKDNCILLQKDDGHFFSMEFQSKGARDFALNRIWEEIQNKTEILDLDPVMEMFYSAEKYNV